MNTFTDFCVLMHLLAKKYDCEPILKVDHSFPDWVFGLTLLQWIFWDTRFMHVIPYSLVKKDTIYLPTIKILVYISKELGI